ncbi:hypothetical protein ACOSP7_009399 [Xanthoceras sorbifolium]|uniref:Sucrose transporter n=1 Tax=Xanthoceras sorbifolium TaxID=99658 RepID=A0ABQ8HUW2_9ROSI|nr:hypothetical protein JRO89_XS07G0248900 [Xanthoceras sorbifolium]
MEVEAARGTAADNASSPLRKIICVASIAAGVQFGWALQLSLLTPYVQLLGIPHKWSSLIWLCGPVSGMIVQPIVGYYSDNCTSRFGRRKPFIFAGTILVAIAVFMIGYAADLGHVLGDSLDADMKSRAILLFALGFWILDVANNTMQGPCRALLADLSGDDHKKTRSANYFFSFFMAVGNVLGYAAGSITHLYHVFPFTKTAACDVYCANLKSCFFLSIALLLIVIIIALCYVSEKPWSPEFDLTDSGDKKAANKPAFFSDIAVAMKGLERPMWILILVTCLNWIAWFPFLLFDTDWMGKEVYGGNSSGTEEELRVYDNGVRAGALGLMLNSIVLGIVSLGIETVSRMLGGVQKLWGIVNFILAICLALTVLITKLAESNRRSTVSANGDIHMLPPLAGIKAGALAIFTVLGIPLAVTYSVPFALASIFCKISDSGSAGQGLSLGVLNLAIVIPQMVVSLLGGPFDSLFGGGNLPAFVVGAVAAAASGIVALTLLPPPPSGATASQSLSGGFH